MAGSFEGTPGTLGEQLVAALEAGQAAGGDRRGKVSAALLVVQDEAYPSLDLRMDEHADPVAELRRIYDLYIALPYLKDLHPARTWPPDADPRSLRGCMACIGPRNGLPGQDVCEWDRDQISDDGERKDHHRGNDICRQFSGDPERENDADEPDRLVDELEEQNGHELEGGPQTKDGKKGKGDKGTAEHPIGAGITRIVKHGMRRIGSQDHQQPEPSADDNGPDVHHL